MLPGPVAFEVFLDSRTEGVGVRTRFSPERSQLRRIDEDRNRSDKREVGRYEVVLRQFPSARVDEFDIRLEASAIRSSRWSSVSNWRAATL